MGKLRGKAFSKTYQFRSLSPGLFFKYMCGNSLGELLTLGGSSEMLQKTLGPLYRFLADTHIKQDLNEIQTLFLF